MTGTRINSYEEPSEWGLLDALRTAAQQCPSHFIPSLWKYRELDASRYLAILEGCLRSGIEGVEVDWAQLLKETATSIRKVILPAANAASDLERRCRHRNHSGAGDGDDE